MQPFCLVVADAARARLYTVGAADPDAPGREVAFHERTDLVNSERRRPAGSWLTDRTSTGYAPTGRRFGLDEHRDRRIEEVDRRFAADIAAAARQVIAATGMRRVVVVASPNMLRWLRHALDVGDRELVTYALDLTRFTTPRLHDHLAGLGVVPPRARAAG